VLQGTGKNVDVSVSDNGCGWEWEISLQNESQRCLIETGSVASGCDYKTKAQAQRQAIRNLRKLEQVFRKATQNLMFGD